MLLSGERSGRSLAVYVPDIIGAPASPIKQRNEFAPRNPKRHRIRKRIMALLSGEILDLRR